MTLVETHQDVEIAAERDWTAEFLVGYGPLTRKAYASDLASFFDFCENVAGSTPQNATRALCAAFSRHATENLGLSGTTVARRLSAVSSWFQYAVDEQMITVNPAARIRRPRQNDESVSTGLTKSELTALLDAAETDSKRSYALILLLSKLGLRISEALNLDWDDFGFDRGFQTISIIRKGGKKASLPLNTTLANALNALNDGNGDGPVFRSSSGKRMDRFAAWKTVRRLAKVAVPEKADTLHPHDCRHAFVTLALDAGGTLRDVQDAAGHTDPRTTRRYDRARGAYERHPIFLLDD